VQVCHYIDSISLQATGRVRDLDEECNVGADAFAASVCAWPGVLIMSVNAPITSADCRRKREVIRIVPSNKAARFFQNAARPLSFPV
jgi:hypothetical protein